MFCIMVNGDTPCLSLGVVVGCMSHNLKRGVELMHSQIFKEYASKRIEEMISTDEECITINRRLLDIEKEIIPVLSSEMKEKLLEMDRLNFALLDRICSLLGAKIEQNEQKMSKILDRFLT